jgi:hypothetical protein
VIGLFFMLYLLPSYIGVLRRANASGRAVVLNVLAGWTLYGWIQALIWAMGPVDAPVDEGTRPLPARAEESEPGLLPGSGPTPGAGDLGAVDRAPFGDPGTPPGTLTIRTFGGLRLAVDDRDLTGELVTRPVVGFLWLWLLVHAVVNRGAPALRDVVAEEMFPNQARSTQLERLRGRIHSTRALVPALAGCIRVDGGTLSFDLQGCAVDVVELGGFVDGVRGFSLTPAGVARAESLAASTAGEVLPQWEALDDRVTEGRGASDELIADLRGMADVRRAELLEALGQHYLAARSFSRAAEMLAEAATLLPDRADLAEQLLVARTAARSGPGTQRAKGLQ